MEWFIEHPRQHPHEMPYAVQVARDKLAEMGGWAPAYQKGSQQHGIVPVYPARFIAGWWEDVYARLWNSLKDNQDVEPTFSPESVWWAKPAELEAIVRNYRLSYPWWYSYFYVMVVDYGRIGGANHFYRQRFPSRLPYFWEQDAYRWSYNNWVRWAIPHIGKIAPIQLHTIQRDPLYAGEILGEGKVQLV